MSGQILNEEVWKLFEKAGFQTIPNSSDPKTEYIIKLAGKPRTPDLLAIDKIRSVRILGENKSGKKIGSSTTAVINDFAKLIKADKANAGVLIITEKEVTDEEIKYAKKNKVYIWNEEQLRYFQVLVDTLGEYSKYELLSFLEIQTDEQGFFYSTIALNIQQPFAGSKINIYLFSIPPQILLQTSVILRKAQGNKDAYQRILNKKRLHTIQEFVSKNNALLPTNIILHFNDEIITNEISIPEKNKFKQKIQFPKSQIKLINLQIPLKYGSLEILDGQHRLYSFLNTDAATKEIFNLIVCGLKGMDNNLKRDTFISINDNAKKIDPNLVAYLKLVTDENECQNSDELMAIRVVYELNKATIYELGLNF